MKTSLLRSKFVLLVIIASTGFAHQCCLADTRAALKAPPGFYTLIPPNRGGSTACAKPPQPFTKSLNFPSKYEGSGSSRDELNVEAEHRYKEATSDISSFEIGVAAMSSRFIQNGSDADGLCAISWLVSWAEDGALLGEAETHTGKSVRKWVLAAASTSYLRLKGSGGRLLEQRENERTTIETWLRALASKVVVEWPVSVPVNKINNHFYWAAWSLVSTATVLNDRALFDQGMKIFRIFEQQLTDDGLLPNEVSRKSRALGYHAYALAPLAMIATFGIANGEIIDRTPKSPLSRLASTVFEGFQKPTTFSDLVGTKQQFSDKVATNFSWIEPYCSIAACEKSMIAFLQQHRPLKSTRLGGDLTTLFGPKQP